MHNYFSHELDNTSERICVELARIVIKTDFGRWVLMRLLMVLVALMLSACATPNLDSFAKSSAETQRLLEVTAPMIVKHMSQVEVEVSNAANRQALELQRQRLTDTFSVTLKASRILAAYSEAVSRVAGASENGKKAANSIISSLNVLGASMASPVGATPFISDTTSSLLSGLTGAIQGAAANAKLYEIMEGAQADLNAIEAAMIATRAPATAYINAYHQIAINAIDQNLKNDHLAYAAHSKQIMAFKSSGSELHQTYATVCRPGNNTADDKICDCGTPPNASPPPANACSYADMGTVVRDGQKYFLNMEKQATELRALVIVGEQAYKEAVNSREATRDQINAQFELIEIAAKKWNSDHRDVVAYLKKCKGMTGIVQSECDFFSASNLELGIGALTKLGFLGITP